MSLSARIQRLTHVGLRRPVITSKTERFLLLPCHAPLAVRTAHSAGSLSSLMKSQSKSRVSTLFTALVVLAVGSTSFGLYVETGLRVSRTYQSCLSYRYQFYNTFTMWPKEVRGDLRAGIKAKHQGDFETSEKFLRRCVATH